ncbi:MAG: hypothetical protein LZF62_480007 [Nitrospira sp.]|nr:MAG: hypothetical protein LZF62_480007 [Nitrospira sp.]
MVRRLLLGDDLRLQNTLDLPPLGAQINPEEATFYPSDGSVQFFNHLAVSISTHLSIPGVTND